MVNENEFFNSEKITDAGTYTPQKDSRILKSRSTKITLVYKTFGQMFGSNPENFRQVCDNLAIDDDAFRTNQIP